jgi:hypothetical protein
VAELKQVCCAAEVVRVVNAWHCEGGIAVLNNVHITYPIELICDSVKRKLLVFRASALADFGGVINATNEAVRQVRGSILSIAYNPTIGNRP